MIGAPRAPVPQPNIAAAHGLGPAKATDEALTLLAALGLVSDGRWTSEAETVLWRRAPVEWQLDFCADPRFAAAVDHACASIPADLRAAIDTMSTVSETELAASRAQADEDMRASGKDIYSIRPEQVRRSEVSSRVHNLDWLFYRRWRLADGWLAPAPSSRPLEIFHDPLAKAMRRAVVARLHPDRREFAV